MTMEKIQDDTVTCPAQGLMKLLSGKWKPEIFRLALDGPLRFNTLLRQINGSNKQSLSVALKELEASGLLTKTVVREKPLHIEYVLSAQGQLLIPVFRQIETLVS